MYLKCSLVILNNCILKDERDFSTWNVEILGSLNVIQDPLSQLDLFGEQRMGFWYWRCLWDVLMSGDVLPYELSVWIPLCPRRVAAWDVFWLFGMCFWVLRCFREIFQQCFLAQMGCTVVKSTQILGVPSQELNINGYLKKLTILLTYHIQGTFFLFKCQFKILGSSSIF